MKKYYLIRKINFVHNDLENIAVDLGDVVGVFDEYERALEAYLHCERHQHQQWQVSSFEITNQQDLMPKIQTFFEKYFLQTTDFKNITEVPPLPANATLAQTAEYVALTGLRHYDLSAHEELPTFYKIKMADDFWGEEEEFPFTIFPYEIVALSSLQESQEQATQEALNVAYNYLWHDMLEETDFDFAGLRGKLTDLSKTPDALAHYVENCYYFGYDDQKQKIRLLPTAEEAETQEVLKELSGLFDLLIQKPFFITRLDLEAMMNKVIEKV